MKRIILSALLSSAFVPIQAQSVTDTVSVGAGYANQVWYSLANSEQGSAAKNNWDIAFDATGRGSGIMINSANNTTLWKYPNADTTGWDNIDTAGMSTWDMHYNSDTSWALGAIGNYPDPANPFDLDWGLYNMTTHIVTGDAIYILKLFNGAYKKLWIESLAGNTYTFRYADLDGSNLHEVALDKNNYTGKNFGYYSLQNNSVVDREPAAANWDLVFTQYTAFIPSAYTVTGVLSNTGVEVAKVSGLADAASYTDYTNATFSTEINTIGYNWKSFNGSTYEVADSTLYFVKDMSGDIWKVIFTGFGGSTTGNFMFSKERLVHAAVTNVNGTPDAEMSIYPNPSNNGQVANIIYSFAANMPTAAMHITDMAGRTVVNEQLGHSAGLHQYRCNTSSLTPGMYLVNIDAGNIHMRSKLVIR